MTSSDSQAKRPGLQVAVLVPCYNEERSIERTIADFRDALPGATIYVYDNASTDRTAEVARACGAVVGSEPRRGKGNVLRRMFADVDADLYVMTDGDSTYDAARAPEMIAKLIDEKLDMVVGVRQHEDDAAYRPGHVLGNSMFNGVVSLLFEKQFTDILSGYRVLSRRFVRTFPILSSGFEIETELCIHALHMRVPVGELPVTYSARPEGSVSKLRTLRDGFRILWTIVRLFAEMRPFTFFLTFFGVLLATSLGLGSIVIEEFIRTGLVPRFPTAILATGLALLAFLSLACGFILDNVSRGRHEFKRLRYLAMPPLPGVGQTPQGAQDTSQYPGPPDDAG